jgi:two-component system NtrC family response regulator
VLVVEDDETLRRALFVSIRDRFGLPVFLADSVAVGRQTIERQHDRLLLVLLDVKLPDGNGLTLLPVLRAVECAALPVVLTAYASEEVAQTVLEQGVIRYLHKSCSTEELHEALSPLIELALQRREDLARPPREDGAEDVAGTTPTPRSKGVTKTEAVTEAAANTGRPLRPGAWYHMTREQRLDWVCANYEILPEERIVMDRAAAGLTNAEIAEQAGWTVHNVKYHVRKVLKKLQVRSRHEIDWLLS